ncbi:MAG: T9SS type A sorting domain-containing protein [Bacteroidales bacterium]|nr:T9SS type A sorting domain-containing protein [Bacteroidales bacterium]
MKSIARYIMVLVSIGFIINDSVYADVFVSKANGRWVVGNRDVWTNVTNPQGRTYPDERDDVKINHIISLNASDCKAKSVVVGASGTLYVGNEEDNRALVVSGSFENNNGVYFAGKQLSLTVGGDFINNKNMAMGGSPNRSNNTLVVKGDFVSLGSSVVTIKGNNSSVVLGGDVDVKGLADGTINGSLTFNGDKMQKVNFYKNISVNNLVLNNTSCGTNGTVIDNNQGVHVADGINIEVSNKLTMTNGVLHIGANNYVSVTKSGVDEQTAVATPGSDAGGALANQLHCYIDGRLIRYVRTNEVTLMPIGDGARSGYCTVKVRNKRLGSYGKGNGTNTQWEARYYNHKSNVEGSNSDIYQYLAEEYWEVKNNGYSTGYGAQIQARVDRNLVDFELSDSGKKGILSGIFKYDGSSNTGWTEMKDAYAKKEGKFNGEFAVINEDEGSGTGSTFKPTNDSPWMFTYGIKETQIEEIKAKLKNLGQQWSGKANDQKWENPANWLNGQVPDAGSVVKIESNYNVTINNTVFWFNVGNGNYPVVSAGSGEAKAYDIDLKSTLLESPAMLTIMDGGNLNVQNLLRVHSGSVHVNGQLSVVSNSFIKDEDDPQKGSLEIDANGSVSLQYSEVFGDVINNGTLTLGNNIFLSSTSSFVGSGTTISTAYDAGAFAILNNGGNFAPTGTLEVKGNIENNNGGSFSIVDGTLRFTGTSGLQLLSNTVGTTVVGNLVVDNSNGVNVTNGCVEVSNELNLKNGVVILANNNHLWLKGNTLNRTNGYVDGMLYRTLPSAANKTDITKQYLFPVGNNGVYSYAKIGPNKSGDVVGVQYFNVKPTQGSGSELYGNLSSEYWKVVTKSGEQAGNVYITLNYDNSDNFEPALADYYSLAHYDGMRWTVYDRDEANNKAGIDAVNKLVYYKTGISVNNDGPYAHLFTLGYTKRVDRWTGSKSSAWSDDDNWSGGLVPSVMAFIPSLGAGAHNYPVIGTADNVGLTSVVVDGNQATLTINGGTLNTDALTVTDNTNPGHVIINQRYDQSSNLIFGSTNYNGNFTVNRTLKTNILNYVGSATTEGTIENWNPSDYLGLYDYNTEKYNSSASGRFADGIHGSTVGMIDANVESKTITQIGTIATGDVTMSAPLMTGKWYAWHMFSNPYQAALDLESDFASFDHVEPIMWFRSFDSGSYKYTTYSVSDGVQVSQASKPCESVTAIAPQQAFFVRTTSQYATPKIVFKQPTESTVVAAGTSLKAVKAVRDVLRLTVESEIGLSDETAMLFREGGSLESIQRDAMKRFETKQYNQIYSLKDAMNAKAIAVYPRSEEVGEELVPFGVQLAAGATAGVIKATNIDEFSEADEVVLYDFVADRAVNLRDVDEYQFEAPAGMRINDRFAIGLKNLKSEEGEGEPEQGSATAIGNVINGVIMICQNDDRDAVVSVSADMLGNASMVNVYDMSGRLVKKQNIEQTKTVVALGDQKGVYIVEAICGDKSQKAKMRVF